MGFSFNPIKALQSVGQTVVNTAKDVGNAAVGAGHAAVNAAEDVGEAVGDAGEWIGEKAKDGYEETKEGVQWLGRKADQGWDATKQYMEERAWPVVKDYATSEWDEFVGFWKEVGTGWKQVGDGIGDMADGNWKEGFADVGRGLLKGSGVQPKVDDFLLDLRQNISAVQTLVGVEKPSRGLTGDEEMVLREVYGDSIDYSKVRIKEGSAGIGDFNNRPFTSGNTIYMKANMPDRATDPAGWDKWKETLVHEMAHVRQFQKHGAGYQSESLAAQVRHGKDEAYNWERGMAEGKTWNELNPEQQARLIEDAYKNHFFTSSAATYKDPATTAYMRARIAEMQAE
jgi:hypothetical protein